MDIVRNVLAVALLAVTSLGFCQECAHADSMAELSIECQIQAGSFTGLDGIVDGIVIAHDGQNKNVYGFDSKTCENLWTVSVEDLTLSDAEVFGHTVIVVTLDPKAGHVNMSSMGPITLPGYVMGLDAMSGQELWRSAATTGYPDDITASSGVVLIDGEAHLEAFDLVSGNQLWQAGAANAPSLSSPLAVSGVYVRWEGIGDKDNESANVVARRITDGQVIWSVGRLMGFSSELAASSGTSSIIVTSHIGEDEGDGTLIEALNATGAVEWHHEVALATDPLVVDGTVYLSEYQNLSPDGNGILVALSVENGDQLWSLTGQGLTRADAVYGSLLVAMDEQGLLAIDTGNGSVRWKFASAEDAGAFAASPIVVNDKIVIADGTLLSQLDLMTGRIQWQGELPSSNSPDGSPFGWCMSLLKVPMLYDGQNLIVTSCESYIVKLDLRFTGEAA